jgi:hypothetical protein
MTRELKELFKTPTLYIAISLLIFLCGLKFYGSIISFMDLSDYYPQLPYGSEQVGLQGDIYELAFSPFYRFVGALLVIVVPVISSFLGNDRINNMDKLELLGTGTTEFTYILRKIFSSVFIFSLITLPMVLFPLALCFFVDFNFINMATSFFALFCIITISSSLSMPIGVLKFSIPVTIFLNLCVQVPLYMYFLEKKFISFFVGVIGVHSLAWTLVILIFSVLLSKKIYRASRIFG